MLIRNERTILTRTDTALVSLTDVQQAQQRIRGVAHRTPMIEGFFYDRRIFLKAESMQPTGSFKLRGAYNKAVSVPREALERGVITYSSGNHGQGVAYAARVLGVSAIIVMPASAPAIKRQAIEALGAKIFTVGPASAERKQLAEELAALHGYTMIPPYDDAAIIAGQGTCGLEILEDLPEVELVLVPCGGGGLLSGIAAAIKLQHPQTKVWGVEPELAADAAESIAAERIIGYSAEQTSRTSADGLRTQHVGERNFAHLRAFVDGMLTVSESEIAEAMRAAFREAKITVEPSGAVALAAALFHSEEIVAREAAVCAVLSGGNVEPELLAETLRG